MSARKIENSSSLNQKVTFEGRQARLELSAESVAVHKNGIEFRSPTPFNEWAEMTVSITSPRDGSQLQCSGVVIACSGNRHAGYHVSMVFTAVSRQAQAQLNSLVYSDLGAG